MSNATRREVLAMLPSLSVLAAAAASASPPAATSAPTSAGAGALTTGGRPAGRAYAIGASTITVGPDGSIVELRSPTGFVLA
jgi:hypothetical protein